MKKLLAACSFAALISLLTSCGGGAGNPKATLESFFEALGKKDIAKARTLATAESKTMLDLMETGMKMAKDDKEFEKYGKDNVEFGEAKIEGDHASIPVKDKKSGESINYQLKKEGGQWKVAFDKNSVMQMGMEKMKEGGAEGLDSLNKGLDELKNINVDSLKEGLEKGKEALDKGKEALDSVSKALKSVK